MTKLIHIGDALAVPFFLLLAEYFYLKENKSIMEYFFLAFTTFCFFIDIVFTSIHAPELLGYVFILTLGVQAYSISNGWLGPLASGA
jgi:hypothetical protein